MFEDNTWIDGLGTDYFISVSFGIILKKYKKFIHRKLENSTVTSGEFPFVMLIYRKGPMIQNDMANYFMVSNANITKTIHNLESKSIIERRIDPNNKRKKYVSLTPTGEAFCKEMTSIQKEWNLLLTEKLTKEEEETFGKLLYNILNKSLEIE